MSKWPNKKKLENKSQRPIQNIKNNVKESNKKNEKLRWKKNQGSEKGFHIKNPH
jgi:hypothetical protein